MTGERAWIEAQLAELGADPAGPIEMVHAKPWSTVYRIPTSRGVLFFKASAPPLHHEPAIAQFVGRRRPDLVPEPLAIDPTRGWMLMADAGTRLGDLVAAEHDVTRWMEVLPAYARLQVDLADSVDDLLALGAPDVRLPVLPARFASLLDGLEGEAAGADTALLARARVALPTVAAMCDDLARYRIPETIQHDDLHDGSVYLRDGRYSILDWGDACVSHPFFSLSVTIQGVIGWGPDDVEGSVDVGPYLDAYLGPYAAAMPGVDVHAAAALAIRLGWACRAVNGHVSGVDPGPTWTRLRMFLDGRP